MATTEEVLVRIKLDTASRERVETALRKFRQRAKNLLEVNISFRQADINAQLQKVKDKLRKVRPQIQKLLEFQVKIDLNNEQLALLRRSFSSIGTNATKLQNAVTGLSSRLQGLARGMTNVQRAQDRVNTSLVTGDKTARQFGHGSAALTTSFFGFIAAAAIGNRIIQGTVETFAEFETRLVRVGRLVGLSGGNLEKLGKALENTATELGVATNDVLGLAEAAARLGVRGDELVKFTKQTQQIAIALQITGEEAAEAFKSLTLLFKLPIDNIINIGNAINGVADASAISARELNNVIQFIAPVLNQFNVLGKRGVAAAAALGTVLKELGVSAEVAGSSTQRLFQSITKFAPEAARVAGLPLEEFNKLLKLDIVEALGRFAEGFGKLDVGAKLATQALLGLNNVRVSRVLSLLANNFDRVRQKQELATAEFENGVSVVNEVNRQLDTLNGAFQQISNEISAVIREAFAPLKTDLVTLINFIREMIVENREFVVTLVRLGIRIGAFLAAFGAIGTLGFVVVQVFNAMGSAMVVLANAANLVTLGISGWAPAFDAASRSTALLTRRVGNLVAALVAGEGIGPALKKLIGSLSLFGATLGGVAATIGIVVGVIVTLVGAVNNTISAFESSGSVIDAFLGGLGFIGIGVKQIVNTLFEFFGSNGPFATGLGAITQFDRFLGRLIFGGQEFNRTLESMRRGTVDSKEATEDLNTAVDAANNEFKAATTEIERSEIALKKFVGVTSEDLAKVQAEFARTEGAVGDFRKALDDLNLGESVAGLLASGGSALRDAIKGALNEASQGVEDFEARRAAQANALNQFIVEINKNLSKTQQVRFVERIEDLPLVLNEVNTAIGELATQATRVDETGQRALVQFTGLAQILNTLTRGGEGLSKMNQQARELQETFALNAQETRNLRELLDSAGIGMEQLIDKSGDLRKTIEDAFGGGPQGIRNLEDFARRVIEVKDRIGKEFEGIDLTQALATDSTASALSFIGKLTNDQLVKLKEIVREKEKESEFDKLINEAVESQNREDEKGLKNIRDRIKSLEAVLKAVEEGRAGANDELLRTQQAEAIQNRINELKDEESKKTREITQEEKARGNVQDRVRDFVFRTTEELRKQAQAGREFDNVLASELAKEEEALRVIEQQKLSERQLLQVRISSAQRRLVLEQRIREEALRGLTDAAEKTQKELEKLAQSGEDFIRRQKRLLEPDSVIRDIDQITEEFSKAASEGQFAGKEADVRILFEQRIAKVREEAREKASKAEEDLYDKRRSLEEQLGRLQEDLTAKRFAQTEKRRKTLERQERDRLIQEGFHGDLLEQALAEFRLKQRREFQGTLEEIRKTENELTKVTGDINESRQKASDSERRSSNTIADAYKSLESAFKVGAERAKKIREEAEAANKALVEAANALGAAADKLAKISSPQSVGGVAEAILRERENQIKDQSAEIEKSVGETSKFRDSIGDFRESIKTLFDIASQGDASIRAAGIRAKERNRAIEQAQAALSSTEQLEPKRREELNQIIQNLNLEAKASTAQVERFNQLQNELDEERNKIFARFKEAVDKAREDGASIPNDIVDSFRSIIDSVNVGDSANVNGVSGQIEDKLKALTGSIEEALGVMRDSLTDLTTQFNTFKDNIKDAVEEIKSVPQEGAKQLKEVAAQGAQAAKDIGQAGVEAKQDTQRAGDNAAEELRNTPAKEIVTGATGIATNAAAKPLPPEQRITLERELRKLRKDLDQNLTRDTLTQYSKLFTDTVKAKLAVGAAETPEASAVANNLLERSSTILQNFVGRQNDSVKNTLGFVQGFIEEALNVAVTETAGADLKSRRAALDSAVNKTLGTIQLNSDNIDARITEIEGILDSARQASEQTGDSRPGVTRGEREGLSFFEEQARLDTEIAAQAKELGIPVGADFERLANEVLQKKLEQAGSTFLNAVRNGIDSRAAAFLKSADNVVVDPNALDVLGTVIQNTVDERLNANAILETQVPDIKKAADDLSALNESQGQEQEALAGFAEQTSSFALKQAERSAALTKIANEHAADVAAAEEILDGTMLS